MIRKYKYNNLFSTFLSHFFYMVSWFWLISVYNIAVKWKLHWDCRGCRKFSFWDSSPPILLKWDKESPYELHYVFLRRSKLLSTCMQFRQIWLWRRLPSKHSWPFRMFFQLYFAQWSPFPCLSGARCSHSLEVSLMDGCNNRYYRFDIFPVRFTR